MLVHQRRQRHHAHDFRSAGSRAPPRLRTVDGDLRGADTASQRAVNARHLLDLVHPCVVLKNANVLADRFHGDHAAVRTLPRGLEGEVTDVRAHVDHDAVGRNREMAASEVRIENERFVDDAQVPAAGPDPKAEAVSQLEHDGRSARRGPDRPPVAIDEGCRERVADAMPPTRTHHATRPHQLPHHFTASSST